MASMKKRPHPDDPQLEPNAKKIKTIPSIYDVSLHAYNDTDQKRIIINEHHSDNTLDNTTHPLFELPVELLIRIYNQLSSMDYWNLYKTHTYFQSSLACLLEQFEVSYQWKAHVHTWMQKFPQLKRLTVEYSRARSFCIDGNQFPRQLESFQLPPRIPVMFINLSNSPHTLTELIAPTYSMTFGQEAHLPPCLQSLTLHQLQLDDKHRFGPLPITLTYLHVMKIDLPDQHGNWDDHYEGLPPHLLHLHAPFSKSLNTLATLPPTLLSLCATNRQMIRSRHKATSSLALPPKLEVFDSGDCSIHLTCLDLCNLPVSLRQLHLENISFNSGDDDDDQDQDQDDDESKFQLSFLRRLNLLTSLSLAIGDLQVNRNAFSRMMRLQFIHLPSTLNTLHLKFHPLMCITLNEFHVKALPSSLTCLTLQHVTLRSTRLKLLPHTITNLSLMCKVEPMLDMKDLTLLDRLNHLRIDSPFDTSSLCHLPSTLSTLSIHNHVPPSSEQCMVPWTRQLIATLPRALKKLKICAHGRWHKDAHLLDDLPPTLNELCIPSIEFHPHVLQHLPKTLKYLHLLVKAYEHGMLDHLPPHLRVFRNTKCLNIPKEVMMSNKISPGLIFDNIKYL